MHRPAQAILTAVLCLLTLACSDEPTAVADPPEPGACPVGLPVPANCFRGQGLTGAPYLIVMSSEQAWNGTLLLYNRGATPVSFDSTRVVGPSRFLLRSGTAIAATGYRSATPLAREAAEDVEELRQIFVRKFGSPRKTIVAGLSFGGLVTARCAEIYRAFDGALPACGTVAGAQRSYYPLLDLRLVYQHFCRNLPRPDERQYDLFVGLDPQAAMTVDELRARVNECTGISTPAAQRTAAQRDKLANILAVVRIPESGLLTNLEAAATLLKILVQDELGGRNPLSNMGVRYVGSTDDNTLNTGVARYAANTQAAASWAAGDDPTGRVSIPVATLHAIDDSRAYVENESAYREAFQRAGTLPFLFQAYTNQGAHCLFTAAEWVAMFEELVKWIDTRTPPTIQAVAATCERLRAEVGGTCRFNLTFQPASLDTRVYPRQQ